MMGALRPYRVLVFQTQFSGVPMGLPMKARLAFKQAHSPPAAVKAQGLLQQRCCCPSEPTRLFVDTRIRSSASSGDGELSDVLLPAWVLVLRTVQRGPHRCPDEQPHGLQAQGGVTSSVNQGQKVAGIQRNPPCSCTWRWRGGCVYSIGSMYSISCMAVVV